VDRIFGKGTITARVLCRAAPDRSASAADVRPEPVVVVRGAGTVVVA
jgi:hypothetical protein